LLARRAGRFRGELDLIRHFSLPAGGRFVAAFSGPLRPETARFPSLPGPAGRCRHPSGGEFSPATQLAGIRRKVLPAGAGIDIPRLG
jgi:hypothetical protein